MLYKMMMDLGWFVLFWIDEVFFGDMIMVKLMIFVCLVILLFLYMDGIKFDWQVFFVLNWFVWDNFVKMMGEWMDLFDYNDYMVLQMMFIVLEYVEYIIYDYFGLFIDYVGIFYLLFFYCVYVLIYNEWYCDVNLIDLIDFFIDDGLDVVMELWVGLRCCGKCKDYIMGVFLFVQCGIVVLLLLGMMVFVIFFGLLVQLVESLVVGMLNLFVFLLFMGYQVGVVWGVGNQLFYVVDGSIGFGYVVDLSDVMVVMINELWFVILYQYLFECDVRGGGCYCEVILLYFGVQIDDIWLLCFEFVVIGFMDIFLMLVLDQMGILNFVGELVVFVMGVLLM